MSNLPNCEEINDDLEYIAVSKIDIVTICQYISLLHQYIKEKTPQGHQFKYESVRDLAVVQTRNMTDDEKEKVIETMINFLVGKYC